MLGSIRKYYPYAAKELHRIDADNSLLYHYVTRHNNAVRAEFEARKFAGGTVSANSYASEMGKSYL